MGTMENTTEKNYWGLGFRMPELSAPKGSDA